MRERPLSLAQPDRLPEPLPLRIEGEHTLKPPEVAATDKEEAGPPKQPRRQFAVAPVKKHIPSLSPPGLPGAVAALLKLMEENPSSHSVEVTWVDPLSLLQRHLEYRRDTQTLTKWDGSLWEQWTGMPVQGLLAAVYGDSLNNWGYYRCKLISLAVTDALRGRRVP